MIFAVGLPSFSYATVCKYDRPEVEELRRLATWMVAIAGLCGAALAYCVPLMIRWTIQGWRERHERNRDV
jgi:hypothetical protein